MWGGVCAGVEERGQNVRPLQISTGTDDANDEPQHTESAHGEGVHGQTTCGHVWGYASPHPKRNVGVGREGEGASSAAPHMQLLLHGVLLAVGSSQLRLQALAALLQQRYLLPVGVHLSGQQPGLQQLYLGRN